MSKTSKVVANATGLWVVGLLCLSNAGCGSSASSTSGVGSGSSMPGPGGSDPLQPSVTAQGGTASSAGGLGKSGGSAHLVSAGGITIGPDFQPPDATMASAPSDAMAVGASNLDADVNAPGAVSISGSVGSSGSDAVRQIVAGGDIFVSGTLRAADLGGSRQGLSLKTTSGTIYVSGSIDTSGDSGTGQAGGPLTLVAQRVVIAGKLVTAGGTGAAGQAVTGGHGGDISIQATGDVVLTGTAALNGGAATNASGSVATGGDSGSFTIDATGVVALAGTFDIRGGQATAKGGSPAGGAAGALKIGETTPPSTIGMTVPLVLKGGDGQAAAGDGGAAKLEAHGGDLRISGVVDVSGGNSATKPGAGGTIDGNPGPEGTSAGIDIAGQVMSNGGSITKGGSGDGAAGGTINLLQLAIDGNATVEPGAQVQADGGSAGGASTAGAGGLVYLYTKDGSCSMHGKLSARGGAAPDSGGTGGGGGFVYVFTGDGHDRMSGVLIIETDGVIDASGGDGSIGGSARNDSIAGNVGEFPASQDNEYVVYNIAVIVNSDGVHGSDRGWLDNRGQIIVRGGKPNGSGGDVAFHGRREDGNETPIPGNIDQSADGTGMAGDFAGE
jgi:hypothetical protein